MGKTINQKIIIWSVIFVVSIILDVIFVPAWRSWLYFLLNAIEFISSLAVIINIEQKFKNKNR